MEQFNTFSPDFAYETIRDDFKIWNSHINASKFIIGISGGIDSSVVAALCVKIFGKESVVGVMLPCDGQSDIADSIQLVEHLGIKHFTIDIGDAFSSIKNSIENNAVDVTYDCKTNMPARLRMTALFGVAQCMNGVVINTCNLSEDIVGYSTFGGDNFGCYSPLKNLTKTEVIRLGEWLGLPENLAHKTPIDGLQPLTDEEKLGFTYSRLDNFIRTGNEDNEFKTKILNLYLKNRFKLDIVRLPGPNFNFYNWFGSNN